MTPAQPLVLGYLNGHSFQAALVHTVPYAMGAFALCVVLSMLLPRTASITT